MQRWVLVRDGHVRGYLLSEGEPEDERKRALAFGDEPASEAPPLEDAGKWLLAPEAAGLVGDGWQVTGKGDFVPPPVADGGPRIVSGSAFLSLFTAAEVAAMWQSGPEFMVAALRIAAQNEVNLDSGDLSLLLGLAAGRGALSPQRLPRIAAGLPPA